MASAGKRKSFNGFLQSMLQIKNVLSNMGKRALDSHSKSKKHTEALKMPKFTGLTNFMKVESKESNKSTDNLTRPIVYEYVI